MQGPNVKKLIIRRMSMLMVPDGGGLADALKSLSSAENIGGIAREATDWVMAALAAVKMSPGNVHDDDDEAIAGEILRQIEEKNNERSRNPRKN
jgi:hypothetical protein